MAITLNFVLISMKNFSTPCIAGLLLVVVMAMSTMAEDAPKPTAQSECTAQPQGASTPMLTIPTCNKGEAPSPEKGWKCSQGTPPTYPNLTLQCPEQDGKEIKQPLVAATCTLPASGSNPPYDMVCCMPPGGQQQQTQQPGKPKYMMMSPCSKGLAAKGFKCCSWTPPTGSANDVTLTCPDATPAPYMCVIENVSSVCCDEIKNNPDILGGQKPADKPADKPAKPQVVNTKVRCVNLWRLLSVCRILGLFFVTAAYSGRSIYRIITVYSSLSLNDMEYVVSWGWQLQSAISMIFVAYWQRTGSIKYLSENVHLPKIINTFYRVQKKNVLRWLTMSSVMTLCVAVKIGLDVANKMATKGKAVWEPTMRLHPFDFLYRLIGVYEIAALNLVLCFFVTTVQSLAMELDEFNRHFEKMLQNLSAHSNESQVSNLCSTLLQTFASHKILGDKVQKVDKIFQFYVFLMTATGIPISIFAVITVVRRNSWCGVFRSLDDAISCTIHLIGFTIVPAQIYTKHRAIQSHLYWSEVIWRKYDKNIYRTARMVTENVEQMEIGISVGGFIVITKPLILTSISLVIPYLLLCLQLDLGVAESTNRPIKPNPGRG
ncbi:CBR-GUR-5 protein [Ditylenchus destructor]|nr:CBR-GUR-5 protein [Ditylenchus destructor]